MAMLLALFANSAEAARYSSSYVPLTINSQPANTTAYVGDAVKFTVSATSSRSISYAWYKNGVKLRTSSKTLSISSVSSAHAGTYTCRVADGRTTLNCTPFTLTVLSKTTPTSDLKLNSQPVSTTVYEGGSTTFSMNVSSSLVVAYSWTKDGVEIGTGSSLNITNATQSHAGTYGCSVTDAINTINCAPFTLSVTAGIKITQQPSNTTLNVGGNTTFTVAATSSLPLTYSWTKNGTVIGSGSSLAISNATLNDAGTYSCSVSDGVKSASCTAFTLTVNDSVKITQQPTSTTLYEGGSTTFAVTATSSLPMTYSWTKNGTVVGTSRTLTISSAKLSDAGTYSCTVSDSTKTVSCNSFTLTVNAIVRITQQPVSQMLNEGASASMSVTATGATPISYQWYYNGTAISGATNRSLSIATTKVADSGNYHVVVKNLGSSATSSTATLSIAAVVKTGSAMISWQAPTQRADGTPLTADQIAGYELFHSASSATSMNKLTSLANNELSIVVDDLAVGTHYFALATKDVNGLQSALSGTITVTIE